MDPFDRCNLFELALERGPAHDGQGDISFRRIAVREELNGGCNFIDYAEIPPGSTIGLHRHRADEEEFYLVLAGEGEMSKDEAVFTVRPGDLIRNRPDGMHGLRNVGSDMLRLFVFELSVVR
jgi:mannose-6-phosphate isomerase-like protein (cupin superfamily)